MGFEWSLPSLASFVARVLDKAGVDSAHIIGAKAGGAIAMQFAADYPARTRTLSVVHVPVVTSSAAARLSVLTPKEQGARLGSAFTLAIRTSDDWSGGAQGREFRREDRRIHLSVQI